MPYHKTEPKLIDLELELLEDRPNSFFVTDGKLKVFLPKSLTENNKDGTFTMPEWIALEKKLI